MNNTERWLLAIEIVEEPNIHESQVIQDALSACLGDDILWFANTGYYEVIGSEADAAARRDYFQDTLDDWLATKGFCSKIAVSRHRPEDVFSMSDPMETFLDHVIADLHRRFPEIDDGEAQRLRRLGRTMVTEPCIACGDGQGGIGWQPTGRQVLIYPMCPVCSNNEQIQRVVKAAIDNGSPLGNSILALNAGRR